jgi:cytochrome P450
VLADPSIHSNLTAELTQAAKQGDLTNYETIRSLPYLEAVIKEALRLGNEVSGRLPRIDPTDPITYKHHTLPPGTVVSMTGRDLHLDPATFLNPTQFNPDRWLDSSTKERAEKHFVPFGKGARSCVGRDLAWLEIKMATAVVMHRFELGLFETTERDVAMAHDFFSPFHRADSKGLRVLVE